MPWSSKVRAASMNLSPAPPEVATLAVLGPGTLGLAVAAFAAEQGLTVRLAGRDAAHAAEGLAAILGRWDRHRDKGRMTAGQLEAARGRLRACASLQEAIAGADALLEAIPEDIQAKRRAWEQALRSGEPPNLLLTGSSSLPLEVLRRGIAAPGRILGFHLFLPLERMQALELVSETGTDPGLLAAAEALGARLGRRTFRVEGGAGYAASRMALAQGLEAMRLLDAGTASVEALDGLLVHGYGHPVGPLELSDRVGLDLRLSIASGLFATLADARFEPPEVLQRKVRAGELGRKTGKGFYDWDSQGNRR